MQNRGRKKGIRNTNAGMEVVAVGFKVPPYIRAKWVARCLDLGISQSAHFQALLRADLNKAEDEAAARRRLEQVTP
jgi:hypothetical protein